MTDERLNRWMENVVRWLIVVFCGVLLITLTTWVVKG